MGIVKNVTYHTIHTDHRDEAASLAFYLNEHGVVAWVSEYNPEAVETPQMDREIFDRVEALKASWVWFWETSDSGLFGLPMYVKD